MKNPSSVAKSTLSSGLVSKALIGVAILGALALFTYVAGAIQGNADCIESCQVIAGNI